MTTRQKRIDVNEASKEDLIAIPGIGEMTAEAILEFRDGQGRINDIRELEEVEQIDPWNLEALREWLTVGSEGGEEEEED